MSTAQIEQALTDITAATWQRSRSMDELQSFIERRELALSEADEADLTDIEL